MTSALVATVRSSCRFPVGSGRKTEGNARPASAVVTGDWWASRCGLKPAPSSSTATTTWVGSGSGEGGGGVGGGAGAPVQAASRRASSTASRAVRPPVPPTLSTLTSATHRGSTAPRTSIVAPPDTER